MQDSGRVRLAGALAALVLAGCAGESYAPAPPGRRIDPRREAARSDDAPTERAADAAARAAAPPAERMLEPPRRVAGASPPAAPAPAGATRHEDARAAAVEAPAAAAPALSARRAAAAPATAGPAEETDAPAPSSRVRPAPADALPPAATTPGAPEDEPAAGGAAVWLLGVLLAAAVAGGGWFALQPKWVRRRVWRTLCAAPGRVLARLRRARAGEVAGTTGWSSAPSSWVASDEAPPGLGGRVRHTRRPSGKITDVTLPAFRAVSEDDPDAPTS